MTGDAPFRDRILGIGELALIEGCCRRTIRRKLKDGRLANAGGDRARGVWLSDYLRAYGRNNEADALVRATDSALEEHDADA